MDINIKQLRALYNIAAKNGRLDLYAALALDWAEQAEAHIEKLQNKLSQRTARLQILKEYFYSWEELIATFPEAKDWFNEDGTPK